MKLRVELKTNWNQPTSQVLIRYPDYDDEWFTIPMQRAHLTHRIAEDINRIYGHVDEIGDYGTKGADDITLEYSE